MVSGPFGGPRPFSDVETELMVRFEEPISEEDEEDVVRELRRIAQSLGKLSPPVSVIGGPSNDVALIQWTGDRVTETDLKSIRKTMNEKLNSRKAKVQTLSVVLNGGDR